MPISCQTTEGEWIDCPIFFGFNLEDWIVAIDHFFKKFDIPKVQYVNLAFHHIGIPTIWGSKYEESIVCWIWDDMVEALQDEFGVGQEEIPVHDVPVIESVAKTIEEAAEFAGCLDNGVFPSSCMKLDEKLDSKLAEFNKENSGLHPGGGINFLPLYVDELIKIRTNFDCLIPHHVYQCSLWKTIVSFIFIPRIFHFIFHPGEKGIRKCYFRYQYETILCMFRNVYGIFKFGNHSFAQSELTYKKFHSAAMSEMTVSIVYDVELGAGLGTFWLISLSWANGNQCLFSMMIFWGFSFMEECITSIAVTAMPFSDALSLCVILTTTAVFVGVNYGQEGSTAKFSYVLKGCSVYGHVCFGTASRIALCKSSVVKSHSNMVLAILYPLQNRYDLTTLHPRYMVFRDMELNSAGFMILLTTPLGCKVLTMLPHLRILSAILKHAIVDMQEEISNSNEYPISELIKMVAIICVCSLEFSALCADVKRLWIHMFSSWYSESSHVLASGNTAGILLGFISVLNVLTILYYDPGIACISTMVPTKNEMCGKSEVSCPCTHNILHVKNHQPQIVCLMDCHRSQLLSATKIWFQAISKIGKVGTFPVYIVETGVIIPGGIVIFDSRALHGEKVGRKVQNIAVKNLMRYYVALDYKDNPDEEDVNCTSQVIVKNRHGQQCNERSLVLDYCTSRIVVKFAEITIEMDRCSSKDHEKASKFMVGYVMMVQTMPMEGRNFSEYIPLGLFVVCDMCHIAASGVIKSLEKNSATGDRDHAICWPCSHPLSYSIATHSYTSRYCMYAVSSSICFDPGGNNSPSVVALQCLTHYKP